MAFSLGDLIARVGADISGFRDAMRDVSSTLDKTAAKMGAAGAAMTAAFTIPLAGVAAAAIKTAGELEQNSIAFKTMMGSADAAGKHLADLRDFAAKTPFQFTDLVLASKRMQALGFDAKKVVPVLTSVGDAAAALGMGAEGIQRIITALGQMQAKGKVQAEEMRQLAEAGIPAWQLLAKTLNTDVAGAMKAVEARTVDAAVAIPALLAGMNAKFGGLMKQQAQTLMGQWSNLKDQITFALTDVGTALMPVAKSLMENVLSPMLGKVKELATAFSQLSQPAQTAALGIGGVLAAVGPAALMFNGVVTAGKSLKTVFSFLAPIALNPITLAILGVAAAVGVLTVAFRDLEAQGKANQKIFDDWILSLGAGARTAKGAEEAQKKINEALDQGLISAETAAKALEMLADRQKKIEGSKINELLRNTGVSLHLVETSAKKAAMSTDELDKAFKALGVRNVKGDLADAVKAFHALAASGAMTHAQMLKAAESIRKMRIEAGLAREAIPFDTSQGRNATLDELRNLPSGVHGGVTPDDLERLPTYNGSAQLLADILGSQATEAALAARNVGILTDAYHELGLKTPAEIQKAADSARADYELIRNSGVATAHDIDLAFTRYKLRQIELDHELGNTDDELYAQQRKNAEETLRKITGETAAASTKLSTLARQVSTIFTDLSRSLADVVMGTKKIGDAFKDVGKAIVRVVLEDIIANAFGKLVSFLKDTVLPHLGSVGKAIAGILGGGASAAGSVAGSAAGTATAAGGAASAAGGAASTAASGVAQWVGAIGSAVSAVSGVIGNFQFAGMNKSLDVLVNHTLRIFNVVAQSLDFFYIFEGHLMHKLDDIWNSIRNSSGANVSQDKVLLGSIRDYTRLTVTKIDEFIVPKMDAMIALLGGGTLAAAGGAYFDFRGSTFGPGMDQATVDRMFQTAYKRAKSAVG